MSALKIKKSKDKKEVVLSWAEEVELEEYTNFLPQAEKAILAHQSCVIDLSAFGLIDLPQLQVLYALKKVFDNKEEKGVFDIKFDESTIPIIEKAGFVGLLRKSKSKINGSHDPFNR